MSVPAMNLTHAACDMIYGLMEEEGRMDLKLRAFIEGGGCSGFRYAFDFVEAAEEDDTCIRISHIVSRNFKHTISLEQQWNEYLLQYCTKDIIENLSKIFCKDLFILISQQSELIQTELPDGMRVADLRNYLQDFLHPLSRSEWLKWIEVVLDPISFPYLRGASLDYKVDLQGQRFIVSNPNAKTTCGCGSSFSN